MTKPAAVAYFRTSSTANTGPDKDSERRQRTGVTAYAKALKLEVVAEFYDAAVSSADPVDSRPDFIALLEYCAANDIGIVLAENASRFARDLIVQLTGHALLCERDIELIPADAPTHFTDPTPTAEMVRQILGAVSQFEKASLVAKLRHARARIRARDRALRGPEAGSGRSGGRNPPPGQEEPEDRPGAVTAADCRRTGEAGICGAFRESVFPGQCRPNARLRRIRRMVQI
jgi:DNA invertase Pin-like site-specific DNA recombinase